MRTPARIAVYRAALALPLIIILIFGWGPIPAFEVKGSASAMLVYCVLGVAGMISHLQSGRSSLHLTLAGLKPRWDLFARILKVASPSCLQILVTNASLLAITAFVARFGTAALAGYGLASRRELLVSSLVLAFGVGTTTMVGISVGAGLLPRAPQVTLVSCVLAAAIFELLGIGVALSGGWISELFTTVQPVVFASKAYFQVIGLVYGFTAASVILFSAYQGWGRAVTPLMVSLLRVAIPLAGGWMLLKAGLALEWFYALIAGTIALGALVLGSIFVICPSDPGSKPGLRLKM